MNWSLVVTNTIFIFFIQENKCNPWSCMSKKFCGKKECAQKYVQSKVEIILHCFVWLWSYISLSVHSYNGFFMSFNSLWSSDTIWQHNSGSTFAQVMVCCLMVPRHYLNQYWLIMKVILWHSPESSLSYDHVVVWHETCEKSLSWSISTMIFDAKWYHQATMS